MKLRTLFLAAIAFVVLAGAVIPASARSITTTIIITTAIARL